MCSLSLASTTFSTNFETKLRFEIGRYELGSSDFFLSSGRTMAFLQRTGSFDCLSDALHIPEMTIAVLHNIPYLDNPKTIAIVISKLPVGQVMDKYI